MTSTFTKLSTVGAVAEANAGSAVQVPGVPGRIAPRPNAAPPVATAKKPAAPETPPPLPPLPGTAMAPAPGRNAPVRSADGEVAAARSVGMWKTVTALGAQIH